MKIYAFNLGVPHQRLPHKMLLIMKMIIIIMTALLVQASAASLAQKITYVQKNAALSQIFSEIRKQTGYDVLWPSPELDVTQKINADFKNAGFPEVLSQCLVDGKFSFTIEDKTIVIKEKEPSFLDRFLGSDDGAFADVRGVVRNERGEPLEGITVMVKGAKTGTRTNAKGEFVLKGVKKGDVLVFTGVSIEPFEYAVKDDKNIDLNLKARLVQLEEVTINTGYQTISKERFVGSYAQLDSTNYHRRAGMGILERLDGMIPGVLFNKKNGMNGGGYQNPIQIRGTSTINSDPNPLIVVDNFPIDGRFDLNSINPNDIENITVLKDAAAASIWGSRAGNGVIVITTKKGKYNKSISVSASSNVTIENKPDLYYIPRISTSDFIDIEKDLFAKGFYDASLEDVYTWPVLSPVVEILNKQKNNEISAQAADDQINALRSIDTREQLNKYIYKQAVRQQHYLSLDGGTNNLSYNFSFGYNANTPNIQGSKGIQQYTLNTATSLKPLKNLEIQTRINYVQTKNEAASFDAGWAQYPYLKLADEKGLPLYVPYRKRTAYLDTVNHPGLLDWRYRPLDEIRLVRNNAATRFMNINVGTSYQITGSLSTAVNYQYLSQISIVQNQNVLQSFDTRENINLFFNPDPSIDPNLKYPIPMGDILNSSTAESITRNGRASLNYNESFGLHRITAMLSAEISETKGYSETNLLYGYDDRNGSYRTNMDYFNYYPQTYGVGEGSFSQIQNGDSYRTQPLNRLISILGTGSYSFKDRYFLYGNVRRDAANIFGVKTNNKWKPLWSVGGKWLISDEKFFDVDWIQSLALRSSYGYAGNVNNTMSGRLTMLYAPFTVSSTGFAYGQPTSVNNPNLRWEKVGTFNTGIDFALLKGRLGGSVDLYWKKSTDLIASYPFDPTVGIYNDYVNSADLKGNGFELNLNSKNLTGKLNWTSNLGIAYAKTIVTKIYNGGYKASDFILSNLNPSEGKLAYAMSSYKWAGLDPTTGDPRGYLNGEISKDYNAIASDSIQNQIYHGSSVPLYSANLGNTINFKNFSLSFIITGRFNYYFRKPSLLARATGTLSGTSFTSDFYRHWQNTGDEQNTDVPSIILNSVSGREEFYKFAEVNVLRADNIKLQDIRLAYNWTNRRPSKFPVKSAQVFFYPNNLNIIIWRKNKSLLDPDFSGGSSDPTAAPAPKTWTIGASVNL
ncbi:SusC/RagA family TonB-linked outer membrane protein [Pedobacter heparinus]|uniref:SusC/RagA family TonB-linked outer membrane protein n=1 Tax=Pedobacter heparinus TaxID=984 RepID=UPI00292EBE73|nr:SusC/RagA family TonB-linked outer membrane protein [Pedobacter heparinus]